MNITRISNNLLKLNNITKCSLHTFAEKLKDRELIRVHGEESLEFLQALITNDMKHLTKGVQSMYAMFLNNTGRVLYDSIIYRSSEINTYLIECDKSISNELRRHLRIFRVRKKIDIDNIGTELSPWVMFSNNCEDEILQNNDLSAKNILCTPDPRMKKLGFRIIVPNNYDIKDISQHFSKNIDFDSDNDYKSIRYGLGVGEGIEDHPPTKCFPLESNCDYLHGVSFHKGCYLGQELTARVYHTGVIRKRLMPISLTKKLETDITKVQLHNGSDVGLIRSSINKLALALVRVDKVAKVPHIIIDGQPAFINKPSWWPKELAEIVIKPPVDKIKS